MPYTYIGQDSHFKRAWPKNLFAPLTTTAKCEAYSKDEAMRKWTTKKPGQFEESAGDLFLGAFLEGDN